MNSTDAMSEENVMIDKMRGPTYRAGYAAGILRRRAEQVIHQDENLDSPSKEWCKGWNDGYAALDNDIAKRDKRTEANND